MRAQAAAAPLGSSVPMALDVGKSLSEASLSQKAKCYGRWDCTDARTDCPELADSVHWLLEDAKPSLKGMESLARAGHACLAAGVTQRGSSYCREASAAPTARLSRVPSSPTSRAARGGDSHPHLSHRFFSSDEQQTKTLGCSEPPCSAPNTQSSAEESSIADVSHDISTSQCSQRPPSPFSSTLDSLPQPTPLSPRSSFSTLSLEENSASEQQEVKQAPGSPAEGKAPRAREPLGALLAEHVPVGRARKMSPYQADYWACAIPDSLPPSPDRGSPHWDPHQEYEDLLDYAYPLRPRYKLGKAPEPFFHDSGIDLDSFSLSPEGTLTSTSVYGQGRQAQGNREKTRRGFGASARRYSTLVSGKPSCVRAISYGEPSAAAKASVAKSTSSNGPAGPSRGFLKDFRTELAGLSSFDHPDVGGRSWCHWKGSPSSNSRAQAKSAGRFLATTQVLPLRKEWDGDEEFLALPPRLRELERLSQILSDLSLTKRTSRQGPQTPPPYSDSKPERSPFRAAGSRHQRESTQGFLGLCHPYSSQKPSWEGTGSCSRADRDPLGRLHLPAGIGGALDGTCPSELGAKGSPKEKGQQGESLAQCIKMFCCQLEELICWLYDVAELTDSWVPPTPDAASVKAALRRYLEFRRDVADHRSLTESVLQRGEALLECMASNSPALKETLGLIAKQSEELESHAERLYKSVLAAVDPGQGQDREQGDSTRQAAAQWVLPPSGLGFVGCSQDG